MATSIENESCRVCCENLPKKSRRSIFSQFFGVLEQLCEVTDRIPHACDGESPYVCSGCFNKLNKLYKIEYDLKNKVAELRNQKLAFLGELRKKYQNSRSSTPTSTPRKLSKRIIKHSPTPRKVKRPASEETPNVTILCKEPDVAKPKSKKKLMLTDTTNVSKEFTPGKVKVSILRYTNRLGTFLY